jgi:glycosyltransferase involved in cell wall biosynthesis
MKVNIVTLLDPAGFGGLESYVRTLHSELKKQGIEVAFNGSGLDCDPSIANLWHSRTERLLPLMTRKPLRHIARWLAEQRGRGWAEIMANRFEVNHMVGTGWDLLGFPLAKAVRKASKVLTCWPAVHPHSWGDAPLDLDFYKCCNKVFCLSNFEANHLQRLGLPSSKTVVLPCGPERNPVLAEDFRASAESFRKRHGIGGRSVVLFVGRKSRGKGYHALREAIRILYENGEDVVLVAIGREVDPPFSELPPQNVIDLGSADDATKHAAFAACDIFVLPSEAESFGIVYVEAWSYGKPVVCGTAPASRELITKHDGGIVSNGTDRDIAEKITVLLQNADARKSMGENGKRAFREFFNPTVVTASHLKHWEMLLSSN